MSILESIAAQAKANLRHIVMSEGEDSRVVEGGLQAAADGLARVTFIGRQDVFEQVAGDRTIASSIEVIDPATFPLGSEFAETYAELRKHKGVSLDDASKAMADSLGFAAMMVRLGYADGTIGGAVATTADTVRAALTIIGKDPNSAIVSSFFLMILKEKDRPIVFADCALVVYPTKEQLATIAVSSAKSFEGLVGETPRVAMLAFSTQGSAKDERLTEIADAVNIAKQAEPGLIIDGEIQFDAAFVPSIGSKKIPNSPLEGNANVFIFPDLHAANIGYKIAQRIGGATAIGPILQGLAKPANDLSRGCSADDVYQLIAFTAVQAGSKA